MLANLAAAVALACIIAPTIQPPPAAARPTAAPPAPEAVSLLGVPLHAQPAGGNPVGEAELQAAQRAAEAAPDDPDALIWLGRRYGYLWRMNDAVAAFTRGVERFPNDPRFLRHRGHRHISLRRFADAERDLTKAAELLKNRPDLAHEVEPDGQPNARNIPLTTTGFNVYYHLALVQYLQGNYVASADSWAAAADHSRNIPDNIAAVTYWRHLTLRHLRREADAAALLDAITPDMEIIENAAYHRVLLLFKAGDAAVDRAVAEFNAAPPTGVDTVTLGAGLGHRLLLRGDAEGAARVYSRVVESGPWPAFGVIAAEAELTRIRSGPARPRETGDGEQR